MNTLEEFRQAKEMARENWLKNAPYPIEIIEASILRDQDDSFIVKCSNGLYINFKFQGVMADDTPKEVRELLENKVMILCSADGKHWENVGAYVTKGKQHKNQEFNEAIEEFASCAKLVKT